MMEFKPVYPNLYCAIRDVREKNIIKRDNNKGGFKPRYSRESVKLPRVIKNIENVKFEYV